MKLPKSWNDITVEQFKELKSLDNEDFDSLFSRELESLAILTNSDTDEFEEMDIDELISTIAEIKFIKKPPTSQFKHDINEFKYKGCNSLTLGEFIDLEVYFSKDYILHLPIICGILYRKHSVNSWGVEEIEPYKFNPLDRVDVFNELPISYVYGITNDYIKFRENFLKVYENLFQPTFDIEDDSEEMDIEDVKAEEEEKKVSRWSWESIIWNLANEDITKVDQVTDLPLILAFNFLSMKNDLQV
jgi:hypothetical protein